MTATDDDLPWLGPPQAPQHQAHHDGLTNRQKRDLLALVLMVVGAVLLLGALVAVDVRLAVGVGGFLVLAFGVLLAVERAPGS